MSQFKPARSGSPVREPHSRPSTSIVVPVTAVVTGAPAAAAVVAPAANDTDAAESPGGAQKLALALTLAFIFLRFSFLHELLMSKLGFDSHLLLLVGGGAVLAALLSGGLFLGFGHRIFLSWIGFTAFMCLATATSIWKGGSFAVLFPFVRTTLLLVVLIPAVAFSKFEISKVLKVVGMAGFIPIIMGLSVDDYKNGRLELSGAGQSIENSNDFAALLILVLPAIAYFTLRKNTNFVLKLLGLVAIALSCYLILGTGSRGALLSILISTLYILKAGSGKVRMALLVGFPILALLAIPFLPGEASQRLASLFNSKDQTEESVASQAQRTALLLASLNITLHHPITGVGPGTFSIYQAQQAADVGQRGMWHETHNTYTQVSSECGIPALLFFLAAIVMTFSVFRRGMKSTDATVRGVSQILALMLVSFSVCMFFLSQAYGFGFPVLGGFAISLDRLLKREQALAAG